MATRINPFQLLSEFIVLILGALLLLLAFSGRVALPSRPGGLIAVGILFIYLGARAYTRNDPGISRQQSAIRAGSLAIVGILLINIALFHPSYSTVLLGVAGAVLVVLGLLSAIYSLHQK